MYNFYYLFNAVTLKQKFPLDQSKKTRCQGQGFALGLALYPLQWV